ncbi:MAG: hypothetical protein GY869_20935, partial [Planctomycetes bacterium]|nr:hypothetical protein [Planctomycetota bacterium]
MIRLIRIMGVLMMATGIIILLAWFIKPLQAVWPWLLKLPWPIQVGMVAAAFGFLLLLASLIWERLEERENDR